MKQLTPKEKAERRRQRMLEIAQQYTTGTYKTKHVAPVFQKMIRAEVAARPVGVYRAVKDGAIQIVHRAVGECVCVTCGKVQFWSGGGRTRLGGMHTGHFIASRTNAIIFQEANVAPQCSACNVFQHGAPVNFRIWMEFVRPNDIGRLEQLRHQIRHFPMDELVDLRIGYMARLKTAETRIQEGL